MRVYYCVIPYLARGIDGLAGADEEALGCDGESHGDWCLSDDEAECKGSGD